LIVFKHFFKPVFHNYEITGYITNEKTFHDIRQQLFEVITAGQATLTLGVI